MRPLALMSLILSLLVPLAGLAQTGTQTGTQTAARPLAAPRDAAEVFVTAVAARDAEAIAAIYAPEAILLSPNANPVAGREAIRAAWEQNFAAGYSAIRFADSQRTDRGTDRAAHLYLWEATLTPPGAAPQRIRGRSLLYLSAVEGGWLISADIWQPIP